jgi:hypothetical protein
LFLSDDDPKKGVWLENGRTLEYYLLRNGVRILSEEKRYGVLAYSVNRQMLVIVFNFGEFGKWKKNLQV